ncbi:MAG: class I tRNA ligase family protein [Thermoproteota archaeon]|nr:class I tRNA ligase family protein [Thermoproteota archaeon]
MPKTINTSKLIIGHLKLQDSFTSNKKNLRVHNNKTRIFLCGPTVYDYCHIGHARIFVIFDVLTRFLESNNLNVRMVVNVTDIDPKLFKRESHANWGSVARTYFDEFLKDLAHLGINGSVVYCKTSDYVKIVIALVKRLLHEKKAYSINGNIYLDTSKMHSFGQLAHLNRKEMTEMRYDIDINKRDPRDMILWNTTDYYGLTYHDATLGDGVPSSHIQDTAVAMHHFNGMYEIHGGGKDLLYPHHEIQLALLQTLTKRKKPVSDWIHVGFVLVDGIKMSKSYNNAVYVRHLLKTYDVNVLRICLLSHHYHQSVEFRIRDLKKYQKLNEILAGALSDFCPKEREIKDSRIMTKFKSYLADDLDTPRALEFLIETAKNPKRKNDVEKMVALLGLKY